MTLFAAVLGFAVTAVAALHRLAKCEDRESLGMDDRLAGLAAEVADLAVKDPTFLEPKVITNTA